MASAVLEHDTTSDPAELAKFASLSRDWWDTTGPMAPLHKLNPMRVAFIRERACAHFGCDAKLAEPLKELQALDIGCGGGLLAEPLARLGATVTGVDPVASSIETARWHAAEVGLEIDYEAVTIEAVERSGRQFELVVASEVIEHVADVREFLAAIAGVTRHGGLVVLSTLSRTRASFVKAIIGAEYLLGWLPRGTHDWRRFLTPAELGRELRGVGLRPVDVRGIAYDAATDKLRLTRDTSVNFLLAATRD